MNPGVLKVGAVIDYTARKRELTAQGLMRCPKCGRIGEKKPITMGKFKGAVIFFHVKRYTGWAWEVLDSCWIKPPAKEVAGNAD
jgi:hypothetical protein